METVEELKAKIEALHKQLAEKKMKGYKCEHCKTSIIDTYFQCEQHDTVFCESCVQDNYRKEVDFCDAVRCKYIGKKIDCIYKPKVVNG